MEIHKNLHTRYLLEIALEIALNQFVCKKGELMCFSLIFVISISWSLLEGTAQDLIYKILLKYYNITLTQYLYI